VDHENDAPDQSSPDRSTADGPAGRSGEPIRVLLVADTHIGFDQPRRPRVARRRRGPDFLACFRAALEPARAGRVDLVVHGGDLLYRSKVPPTLVETALAPLVEVANRDVPVCIVPGNHERSAIPRTLSTAHPNLHILDVPRTVRFDVRGVSIALSGFPFAREIGRNFADRVAATDHEAAEADIKLLCMHQSVEGARVGPADYVFPPGADVVRGRAIPAGFAAVLTGHIHRSQVITHDLSRRPNAAPVIYPGSVERTSFAEEDEDKHFALIDLVADSGVAGGRLDHVRFQGLPARPMRTIDISERDVSGRDLEGYVRSRLESAPPDAVLRVRADAQIVEAAPDVFRAAHLRALVPPSANISLAIRRGR
jgi:DNA repair exonuclease SbcCD nuclease subunit